MLLLIILTEIGNERKKYSRTFNSINNTKLLLFLLKKYAQLLSQILFVKQRPTNISETKKQRGFSRHY